LAAIPSVNYHKKGSKTMAVSGVERSAVNNNADSAERNRQAREAREDREAQRSEEDTRSERSQERRQDGVGEQVNTQA
jgi:hypothetical protein